MQIEKSFSIRNRGLQNEKKEMYVNMPFMLFYSFYHYIIIFNIVPCARKSLHCVLYSHVKVGIEPFITDPFVGLR